MIEQLEPRRMLSGNVQVKLQDGILFLRGDEQANHVTLETTGRYTRVSIDRIQEGYINGVLRKRKLLHFDGTINIDLGGGNDRLRIHNLKISGSLIIRMSGGNDQLAIDNSSFRQSGSFAGGSGDDTINFLHTTSFASTSVRGDDGNDILILSDSTFHGPLSVKGGDGADDLNYAGSKFNSGVRLKGNRGADSISGESVTVDSDFSRGGDGWAAGFAEYGEGQTEIMELESGVRSLPPELGTSGTGYLLSSQNSSDDVFMFLKRSVDGLQENHNYLAVFDIRFASDSPIGSGGAGGGAGDVAMKAGATAIEPVVSNVEGAFKLNVDKGNQGHDGAAASVLGDVTNGTPGPTKPPFNRPFASVQRSHVHPVSAKTDAQGRLWLLVGTDSGFEGKTTLYYERIRVRLVPTTGVRP